LPDLPKISVVLPTRDRPQFLVEAVGSVAAQALLPAELVVVDDGSAADAGAALRRVRWPKSATIRVLPGSRSGPAAARNLGVRSASGNLIAFLDDDDVWHPEKLAEQARWFAARPDMGALGTACVRTPTPGLCHFRRQGRSQVRSISRAALLRGNRLCLSSVMIRRNCLDEIGGFDESLPLAQDWDLWLRISSWWEIGTLNAPLTVYRLHGKQRSRDEAAMRRWEAEVIRRAIARVSGARTLRGVARRRLSWAHCRLGRVLIRRGETQGAVHELKQALSLYPLHPLVWGSLALCALAAGGLARERRA